ncbi:BTAD domain-containing putative transcriptional regulator [Streptomyces sp. B6B3]|uniref:AfsR/SARP family transcriptional regulator n=1 Tax=Streptomyces sp. B6B3 TaxID=3153570 RepID=UPI00325E1E5F
MRWYRSRMPDAVVDFDLLGPVRATCNGAEVRLGTPQRLSVLAVLLLSAGQAVPTAVLRERLWAGPPPASAVSAIQVHMHHLRKTLRPYAHAVRIATHPGTPTDRVSYTLHADDERIDVRRFRLLLNDGEAAQAQGNSHLAVAKFDAALNLWRGQPVSQLQDSRYIVNLRRSLEDMWRDAATRRAASRLALGAVSQATAELQDLHTQHPGDERIVLLLSQALWQDGAQGQAMRLVTDELDHMQRVHGLRPTALLRQREELARRVHDGRGSL